MEESPGQAHRDQTGPLPANQATRSDVGVQAGHQLIMSYWAKVALLSFAVLFSFNVGSQLGSAPITMSQQQQELNCYLAAQEIWHNVHMFAESASVIDKIFIGYPPNGSTISVVLYVPTNYSGLPSSNFSMTVHGCPVVFHPIDIVEYGVSRYTIEDVGEYTTETVANYPVAGGACIVSDSKQRGKIGTVGVVVKDTAGRDVGVTAKHVVRRGDSVHPVQRDAAVDHPLGIVHHESDTLDLAGIWMGPRHPYSKYTTKLLGHIVMKVDVRPGDYVLLAGCGSAHKTVKARVVTWSAEVQQEIDISMLKYFLGEKFFIRQPRVQVIRVVQEVGCGERLWKGDSGAVVAAAAEPHAAAGLLVAADDKGLIGFMYPWSIVEDQLHLHPLPEHELEATAELDLHPRPKQEFDVVPAVENIVPTAVSEVTSGRGFADWVRDNLVLSLLLLLVWGVISAPILLMCN